MREAPKLELIMRHATGGRFVEIGSGSGALSRAAHNAGFKVTAIEMDAACCEYLERVVGVQAIQSDAPDRVLSDLDPANAIAMWHVLEHVPCPCRLVDAAAARLAPGGVLAVATPNPQSLQFRLLRGRWAHVDAPRHLSLIPYAALRARCHDVGLTATWVTTNDPTGRHAIGSAGITRCDGSPLTATRRCACACSASCLYGSRPGRAPRFERSGVHGTVRQGALVPSGR